MTRHYLVVVLRYLQKHVRYSILNILNLSIGMTCGLFILFYIQYELSYDRYLAKNKVQ